MRKYCELQNEIKTVFECKKKKSLSYADVLEHINEKKRASRVKVCGDFLSFGLYDDNSVRLHSANFCSDILCPQCAKRRSLKMFSQVSAVVERLKTEYNFLFMTLTIKNCVAADLSKTCDLLNEAFSRLLERKKVKKSFLGVFKALEITVNKKTDELTYHPHLHCIVVVNRSYFDKDNTNYISQSNLAQMWSECLKVNYTAIVDIRACKDKTFKVNNKIVYKSLSSSVAEVAKYAVKSSDYLVDDIEQSSKIVQTLISTLKNRKMFAFYGVMRKVRAELKQKDDDNDLVHINDDNTNSANLVAEIYFVWSNTDKCYVHIAVKEVIKQDDDVLQVA